MGKRYAFVAEDGTVINVAMVADEAATGGSLVRALTAPELAKALGAAAYYEAVIDAPEGRVAPEDKIDVSALALNRGNAKEIAKGDIPEVVFSAADALVEAMAEAGNT
jgi:hypothetical protein